MNGNSNKILLGVAALLTVVLVVLFISSGTSGGGGGGGSAPAPQQTQDQTAQTQQGDQTTQTDQTQQPGGATQQAPEQTTAPSSTGATQDYDPSAEKQMTLEELEQELDNYQAPVGDNPRDAASSQAVPTVAQAHQTASDRGFGSLDIMVDFALDGTYTDPHVVDASSADKYPAYYMIYPSPSGVYWTIYVNDGNYLATPLGTQTQQLTKEIVLSERSVITQYDGSRNQFSDFPISSLTDVVGVQVPRIDAQTLDSYTIQSLAAM